MKAPITFYIGIVVTMLNGYYLMISIESSRIIGLIIGLFFVVWGWKIGWTKHRNLTLIVGHFAMTIGSLVVAWSIYQIPFLSKAPTLLETLDMPLFWGIFAIWGGFCMITHGYCNCAIKTHDFNTTKKAESIRKAEL
ncbi:MAG: hypothetical protein JXR34_03190 [Bacteroidales bacterium]|nr:hypothetical protein [Bacteroidales bacterium]